MASLGPSSEFVAAMIFELATLCIPALSPSHCVVPARCHSSLLTGIFSATFLPSLAPDDLPSGGPVSPSTVACCSRRCSPAVARLSGLEENVLIL